MRKKTAEQWLKEIGAPANGITAIGKSTPRTKISNPVFGLVAQCSANRNIAKFKDEGNGKLFTGLFTGRGRLALQPSILLSINWPPHPGPLLLLGRRGSRPPSPKGAIPACTRFQDLPCPSPATQSKGEKSGIGRLDLGALRGDCKLRGVGLWNKMGL
jgi:hypothetical protein